MGGDVMVDPVWTSEVALGEWLLPRLQGWGEHAGTPVTALVPGGFDAYARVLHPVGHEDEGQATWAQVCEATGRTAHPLMQWEAISGTRRTRRTNTKEWQGDEPEQGNLQPSALAAVLDVLQRWTAADQQCVMAVWDGFGWVGGKGAAFYGLGDVAAVQTPPAYPEEVLDGPRLQLPGRDYLVFTGSLRSAQLLGQRTPEDSRQAWGQDWLWRQSPNLLWPLDRSWCLASEIDVDSTLVGGPEPLIEGLIADPRLESYPVPPDGDLSLHGDPVNELQQRHQN